MTVECVNGHTNQVGQRYCGECGAPFPPPVSCPHGHDNPPGYEYCGTCRRALSETPKDFFHSRWRMLKRWFVQWELRPVDRTIEGFLWLGILFLIGVVIAIFVYAIW